MWLAHLLLNLVPLQTNTAKDDRAVAVTKSQSHSSSKSNQKEDIIRWHETQSTDVNMVVAMAKQTQH